MGENVVAISGTLIMPQALTIEGGRAEETVREALRSYGITVKALSLSEPGQSDGA